MMLLARRNENFDGISLLRIARHDLADLGIRRLAVQCPGTPELHVGRAPVLGLDNPLTSTVTRAGAAEEIDARHRPHAGPRVP